jgi:hypothetical protein
MASESIREKQIRTSFNEQKKSIVLWHNEDKNTVHDLFINTTSVSNHIARSTSFAAYGLSHKVQTIGITTGRIVDMHSPPSEVDKNDVLSTLSMIKPDQGHWRAPENSGTTNTNAKTK